MKRVAAMWVFVILWMLALPASGEQLKPRDLVAICGDSITEQKLYSVYMQTYLLACQPPTDLRAMQFGWGGEVSWGFLNRLENDVLRFRPTVVTTCYGMNDGGYAPLSDERAAKYPQAMMDVVKKLKDGGVRFVVVGSPGAVDADAFRKDPEAARTYNQTLSQLRDFAREVAGESGAGFADVYTPMMLAMTKAKEKYGSAYQVAGADGVHPGPNGHLVMAYAFLKALGCDGNIATITIDMSGGKAQASAGHQIIESSAGIVEILSTRYPFCFAGEPSSPDATSGIIEFFPFNDELNRYTLIVKNPPADRLRVTWGDSSREFSREQLERGINLAAEFLDNPFSEPFKSVEDAVRTQQAFETPMVKQFIHNLGTFKQMVPAQSEPLDAIAQAMIDRDKELQQTAHDAVKPVRHRIVVAPIK